MSLSPIFCSNPALENELMTSEIMRAVKDVLDSGSYILGSQVSNFEREFASYLDSQFCIGVNSGTDALAIGLKSLGIGIGDEVILPSHTAVATAAAVVSIGAIPVFAEISNNSMTIDPISVESLVTPRTKAIVAVHIYGYPCDLDALKLICKTHDLYLIEDCAQSIGTEYKGKKVGTLGDIGCFSFYPTKNLGAIGDGGAIVTNSHSTSEKCFALRQYGWDSERVSRLNNTVSRLDEIQAAVLRKKLLYLDHKNAQRNEIAGKYRAKLNLETILLPAEPVDGKHTYHLFVIRVNNRDYMIENLAKLGIFAGIHYRKPVHLHPAFSSFTNYSNTSLKYTEDLSNSILSLPMYPGLKDRDIDRVVEGVMSVR